MIWTRIDSIAFTIYCQDYEVISFSKMTPLERAHLIESWDDIMEKHLLGSDCTPIIKKIYDLAKLIAQQIDIYENEHKNCP